MAGAGTWAGFLEAGGHQLSVDSKACGGDEAHGIIVCGPAKAHSVTTPSVLLILSIADHLTFVERDAHLEQLKVFGRDPTNSDPIFTKEVCGNATLTT